MACEGLQGGRCRRPATVTPGARMQLLLVVLRPNTGHVLHLRNQGMTYLCSAHNGPLFELLAGSCRWLACGWQITRYWCLQAERISICSIEKASGSINKLIQEQRLHELVSVTIDEAHMLADPNRWAEGNDNKCTAMLPRHRMHACFVTRDLHAGYCALRQESATLHCMLVPHHS